MVLFCFFTGYIQKLFKTSQRFRPAAATKDEVSCSCVCPAVSYKIIGRGNDEGDHRYQSLDRVIVLALVLTVKTCTFSSDTQNSNVTVSYPKPRKNADVVGGTSLRFISKINTFFLSFFECMSTSTVNIDRRPIFFLYEQTDMVDMDQFLGIMNQTDCHQP